MASDQVASPLIIMERDDQAFDVAARELEAERWSLRPNWRLPERPWDVTGTRVVCVGAISRVEDATAALLAAARGAGLLVVADAEPYVIARLFEDLRGLGPVEYRRAKPADPFASLGVEQRRLLEILSEGNSLDDAARALNYSRRTVGRRLAAARSLLGVRTTAEAVVIAREHGRKELPRFR
jgi:DNA-binding NarL/FixJ family response regulator